MVDAGRFMLGNAADRAIVMAKHRRLYDEHGGREFASDGRVWWEVPAALVSLVGNQILRLW
jgi:hypothetical protein